MKRVVHLVTLALAGCMTPPAPPPTLATPSATGTFAGMPQASIAPVPDDWWRLYDDPVLDKLVVASLAANADLRVAYANLDGARAALAQARAARLPQTSVESSLGVDNPANQPSASALAASWDADLFGRLRSAALAASADADAQAAALDGLKVAVVADTVQAYVDLCGAGQAQLVATEQVRLLERSAALVNEQFRAGEVSPLEVSQAATLVETARAALPPMDAAAANARYRLATLQGRPPAEAQTMALACQKLPRLRTAAPVGDGQALLLRRPDIREAERRLAAASARIGVARADLYPRVNLGGAIGLLSGGFVATASPFISWSFPNQAPARARLAQARATEQAALAGWDVVVLRALREVESALAAYDAEKRRNDSLGAAREQADLTARRAAARVRLGDAAYLLQVDAERTRAQAALTQAQSDLAVAQAEVSLFRALGGGWRSDAAPLE
jgi:NodT family efflux transporter outer membrane factor (OMF) lipoprotein